MQRDENLEMVAHLYQRRVKEGRRAETLNDVGEADAYGQQLPSGSSRKGHLDMRVDSEIFAMQKMWMLPTRVRIWIIKKIVIKLIISISSYLQRKLESQAATYVTRHLPSDCVAFAVPKLHGRIYVVADHPSVIADACKGCSAIAFDKLVAVPDVDKRSVMSLATLKEREIPGLHPGCFVHIRHGRYAGDLAYVVSASVSAPSSALDFQKLRRDADKIVPVPPLQIAPRAHGQSAVPPKTSEDGVVNPSSLLPTPVVDPPAEEQAGEEDSSDVLDLWVLPRIDYSFSMKKPKQSDKPFVNEGPSKKRQRLHQIRPQPMKFDVLHLMECLKSAGLAGDSKYEVESDDNGRWSFRKQVFEYGFLCLRVYGIHSVSACRPAPGDIFAFIGTPAKTIAITNCAYTLTGDRVKTKSGEGTVVSNINNRITVRLGHGRSNNDEKLEDFGAQDIIRIFEVGQWVTVKLGLLSGQTGVIVSVCGSDLMIVDPSSQILVY